MSFGAVDPAVYRFTPPTGAKVVGPRPWACRAAARLRRTGARDPPGSASHDGADPNVRVFGKGWATIVAVRTPSVDQLRQRLEAASSTRRRLLPFSGTLFSVRLAGSGDHAWLLFGAVPQSALQRAATELS